MRILHVLAQLPSSTGSGIYFSNVIKGLKKFAYEQKALFAYQEENDWDVLRRDDQYHVAFKTETMPFPVAGMSDVMPYESTVYSQMTKEMLAKWKKSFKEKLEVAKEEFKPDVIFAHHLWILTSLVVDVFPDTKIIGICHSTDLRQARMNPSIKAEHVKNIEKLDLILTASEEQKNEVAEVYNFDIEKMISVGGGYDQQIFYPPEKKQYDDVIRLVFCAKIDPSKGIYELIEVYKSLGLKNLSLDIIGTPDEKNLPRLKALTEDDPTITHHDTKKQTELGDVLRHKDIFIMPSYYDGLGLIAIESLACGLYVVATEIKALVSFLGDEINKSKVIEYVPLPRIYDTDKPLPEDLPKFKENLKAKILDQIEKVRIRESVPEHIMDKIQELSWEALIDKINFLITKSSM